MVAAVAGAVTVDVVLVVTVTPAVGVWEAERVRTGVSGGDWLPAVVDGGALATTRINAGNKTETELDSGSGAECPQLPAMLGEAQRGACETESTH